MCLDREPDAAGAASQRLLFRQYPEVSALRKAAAVAYLLGSMRRLLLKKCSQLLTISKMFPGLRNLASANEPSP
jgi:hypothetical protein